jgi:hypothetical protein
MTHPADHVAALETLLEQAKQNVAYSYHFATAKPDIGAMEREHILGLCALVNEIAEQMQRQGEPVAWLVREKTTDVFFGEDAARRYAAAIGAEAVPLYAHPAPRRNRGMTR